MLFQRLGYSKYEVTKNMLIKWDCQHIKKKRYVVKKEDLNNWIEEQKNKIKNYDNNIHYFVIIDIFYHS